MSSPERGTPEGALIRVARRARGLSAKEAAASVPIRLGETRWYHIEAGYEGKGKPVVAPPDTLAHMAKRVGVSPERLAEVGRSDAAEILREILRQEAETQEASAVPAEFRIGGTQMLDVARRLPREVLRQVLDETEAQERAEAPLANRQYDDDGLQKLWEIVELSEMERRMAINAIQAWRQTRDNMGESRQNHTG